MHAISVSVKTFFCVNRLNLLTILTFFFLLFQPIFTTLEKSKNVLRYFDKYIKYSECNDLVYTHRHRYKCSET